MKSERRHELHSNELAEWIENFPEWAKENRNSIIYTSVVVILILISVYLKWFAPQPAVGKGQLEMTQYAEMVQMGKMQAAASKEPGTVRPEMLTSASDKLGTLSKQVSGGQSEAFAQIKRGEALRAQIHYTSPPMDNGARDLLLEKAKKAYSDALAKADDNMQIAGMAKLGLGLCEEEAGNYAAAQSAYNELAGNESYAGTVAKLMAAKRAKTLDDYKETIVFVDIPKSAENKPAAAPAPEAGAPKAK